MNRLILLAILLALAIPGVAFAQAQNTSGNAGVVPPKFDPKKPIHIVADRLEADHQQGIVRFIGNVVTVQNDLVMNCDQLVINYAVSPNAQPTQANNAGQPLVGLPATGGEIEKLVAIGRVQMVQGNRRATCDRAEYNRRRGVIELTGNPEVGQGQDVLRGSRILVFVDSQRVDVVGQASQRVQVTINPRSAQQAIEEQRRQQEGGQEPSGDEQEP